MSEFVVMVPVGERLDRTLAYAAQVIERTEGITIRVKSPGAWHFEASPAQADDVRRQLQTWCEQAPGVIRWLIVAGSETLV